MTLEVVGNFDAKEMEQLIIEEFGKIKKTGKMTTKEPEYKATLNHIPYINYPSSVNENYAYIGTKYILDDYKKYRNHLPTPKQEQKPYLRIHCVVHP
jgi:hypothetical protein